MGGLGFEIAAPDIMQRPPQSLKTGVFTPEVMIDMLVYGLWMAALCLSSFTVVLYGFGNGDLARNCNDKYSQECDTVFRARATTFVCLTWFALFLAWEMVNMRRSFFRMQPKSTKYFTQWAIDVWRNKFLFWAVIAGFVTIFPTLYIPVINHKAFKHTGISWEWGIVFIEAILFLAGVEAWKWAKRVYFRRQERKRGGKHDDLEKKAFAAYFDEKSDWHELPIGLGLFVSWGVERWCLWWCGVSDERRLNEKKREILERGTHPSLAIESCSTRDVRLSEVEVEVEVIIGAPKERRMVQRQLFISSFLFLISFSAPPF